MPENYSSRLNFERKNLELEFSLPFKTKEEGNLLDHLLEETELPEWE